MRSFADCSFFHGFRVAVMFGAVTAAGCSDRGPYVAEFPGFSITTPWRISHDPTWRYAEGRHHHPNLINISWSLGRLPTRAEYAEMVAASVKQPVGVEAVVTTRGQNVEGLRVRTTMLGNPAVFAVLGCGLRTVQVIMAGSGLTDEKADLVVRTVTCKPDPTQEQALMPVAPFTAPDAVMAGWTIVLTDEAFSMKRDGAWLRASEVDPSATDEELQAFITADALSTGASWQSDRVETVSSPDGARTVAFGSVVKGGWSGVAAFAVLECKPRRILLSVSADNSTALAGATPVLAAAMCK